MGRGRNKSFRGKGGGRDRDRDRGGGNRGDQPGQRGNYDSVPSDNEKYEAYYKESGLIPAEEWDEFWGSLKRTLPTTFRFTGSKGHALSVLKNLQETHIPLLSGITYEGELVSPPAPIPWFPDNLAWQLSVGKTTVRRCPPFKKFQDFLVAETTVGNISRQEAVSMIPPLILEVEPHHTVLDMCAAPGSKTAQLIEAIHAGEEGRIEAAVYEPEQPDAGDEGENGGRSTGLVIANDADYKRSHMLIHQAKRLNSPNLIVTNHDATWFPSLCISPPEQKDNKEYLKFDRILADVPCTGDGTARKNYGVWRDWIPGGALGLHLTQVRILVRGLQMLKVGGRIVYSTCSMNPIENEAVIASAIDRCGGLEKVSIVDCSDKLPELKRRPGVKGGWKVMDRDYTWLTRYEDIEKDENREARLSRITRSMFPTENGKADDDPTRIPLERCMRVYPHLQDTGGFFIVALEKKADIGAIKPEEGGRKKMAAMARAAEKGGEAEDTPEESDSLAKTNDLEPPVKDIDPVKKAGELKPDVGSMEKTEGLKPNTEGIDPVVNTEAVESNVTEIRENAPTSTPPGSPAKRKILDSPATTTPPVTKKTKILDSEDPEILNTTTSSVAAPIPKPKNENNNRGRKNGGPPIEEPFKFLPVTHPVLDQISTFYSLSPRFPRTNFMVRNAEAIPSRAIYFTSSLARKILLSNEGKNVKFVHCGVKAFMKQDVQEPQVCPWRIQNEGLAIVDGWIGEERIVRCKKRETVRGLLKELFPKVSGEGFEGDVIREIEERVRNMSMGCCILRVEKGEAEDEFQEKMTFPLWKSRHSCNLMLPKEERKAMLLRLFNDTEGIKDSTHKNSHQYNHTQKPTTEAEIEAEDQDEDTPIPDAPAPDTTDLATSSLATAAPGTVDPLPVVDQPPSTKVLEAEEVKKIVKEQEAERVEREIVEEVLGGEEV